MGLYFVITFLTLLALVTHSSGYIDIKKYCNAWDDSFKPMICMLKNPSASNTTFITTDEDDGGSGSVQKIVQVIHHHHTPKPKVRPKPQVQVLHTHHVKHRPVHVSKPPHHHHKIFLIPDKIKNKLKAKLRPKPRPRPPPPHHGWGPPPPTYDYDWDEDDEDTSSDCSCDFSCFPVIANQSPNVTGVSYRCGTCGSSCWVRSLRPFRESNCSCAVLPSTNSSCTCIATCASFDKRMGWGASSYDYSEESDSADDNTDGDLNCIFSIANLTDSRIGQVQLPYHCACCKSTEGERLGLADFVCVCQRVSSLIERGDDVQSLASITDPPTSTSLDYLELDPVVHVVQSRRDLGGGGDPDDDEGT